MPATGIFLVRATPSAGADTLSPYQRIFNNLLLDHHLEPLPHWTLEHRLFRETAPIRSGESLPATPTAGAGVLQVLMLSHHVGASYAAIGQVSSTSRSGTGAPAAAAAAATASHAAAAAAAAQAHTPGAKPPPGSTTGAGSGSSAETSHVATGTAPGLETPLITLPAAGPGGGGGADELTSLLTARFAPLWTRRAALHVAHGPAYRAGTSIVVRFGELREARGGATQQQQQQPSSQQQQQLQQPGPPPGQGQQGQGQPGQPSLSGGGPPHAGGGGIARGTVVEVRYTPRSTVDTNGGDVAMADGDGGEATEEDKEVAEVRKFWATLDVTGAREFVARHEKEDTIPVRLWMEALKAVLR